MYHMYAETACTCTPTNFISYACENCVLHERQTLSYHIYTPKSVFSYQYHEFSFLFGVLFICPFMRPLQRQSKRAVGENYIEIINI